jgi:hypothetical protein
VYDDVKDSNEPVVVNPKSISDCDGIVINPSPSNPFGDEEGSK